MFAPGVSAQHVVNPFAGATVYVNPDWTNEVNTAIATEPAGSTIAEEMNTVANTPTAVWLDHIGAITGGTANSGRLGLQGHINAALAQQTASGTGQPIVVELVIYDLPDRDCAALASNGELTIAGGDTPIGSSTPLTGTGIQEYEQYYITPIYNIMKPYANNSNIRFVLVIEDDSLPNMLTNVGNNGAAPLQHCVDANAGVTGSPSMSGVYVQGISYALSTFHQLPNAYNYLDVGHHGWLGWPNNFNAAPPLFLAVANLTPAKVASVDGFITNTANYGATKEPYMTATETIGGNGGEVYQSLFYQYDPYIDEDDYAAGLWSALTAPGNFPSTLGFLIDTSRNGWGSSLRPPGPSTSTDLNTFVDASKIDLRDDMGQWCNQQNAGIGALPTVNPGGFANLSAYVWIKPPGESDGTYNGGGVNPPSTQWVAGENADENCDPLHDNALANSKPTDAMPNSPPAGTFWPAQFDALVQNAYPSIPPSTKGSSSFFITTAGTVNAVQGTAATSSVSVGVTGGYNKPVTLTIATLPAGVTATFTPATVTGATGSSLKFVVAATVIPKTYPLTVTGTSSDGTAKTAGLNLVVAYAPGFLISVNPTSVTLPPGTNPTASITVTFVGGLTGSVSLSATGLPAGVNANFAPSSVNAPGGTITVNFNAQTSTTPGTYTNVKMVGTNGTVTNSAPLTLVIPGSGFSLSSSPSITIPIGQKGTNTISIADQGTFAGSVNLAVTSALPTGVTASFGTNPATSSSILTLTVGSNAIAGTYPMTVTGTSTNAPSASINFNLVITNAGGFTLTSSAASLTIPQGGSATDTITVTDTGGFSGPVTVSALGSPIGVTGVCGPTNPITGNGNCTLTVSVGSSVPAGTANITVTGTSGTQIVSLNIPITVTQGSGFTLSATPPTVTIPQCGTGVETVTVNDIGAFTGSVTLSASGLPSGVTFGFASNPTATSTTINIGVGCSVTPGSYVITISGSSNGITRTASFTLTVTAKQGFTLSASPSPLTVVQGKTGIETVSIVDQGGFTGGVTLVATGQPAGVTVTYGTNPATSTSQLAFAVGSSVIAGTYPITVAGTSGTLTPATASFNLVVTPTGGFSCHVVYTISNQWPGGFGGGLNIENTGSTAISNWTLTWTYTNGQTITQLWNGNVIQSGANVTVTNLSYNGSIPAGGSYSAAGFNGTWNSVTNAVPTNFAVNGTTCQ
jgi:cellulose 1,4-beta-cellobiosidase